MILNMASEFFDERPLNIHLKLTPSSGERKFGGLENLQTRTCAGAFAVFRGRRPTSSQKDFPKVVEQLILQRRLVET